MMIYNLEKCLVCNRYLDDKKRSVDPKKITCSKRCNYLANYQLVIIHNIRKNMFKVKRIAKELDLVRFGWYLNES